jgi:DNA topoisomerase-3
VHHPEQPVRHALHLHHRCTRFRTRTRFLACFLSHSRNPPAGHLLERDFGPAWKGWRTCAESDLIDPSKAQLVTAVRRDCEPLQAMLRAEARRAAWLILWLDCDREGEAICHEARRATRTMHVFTGPSLKRSFFCSFSRR